MQFLRFRIDSANQCLWRRGDSDEDERVQLTPKAHALLDYLLKHAGRLVTQDELLDSLWPQSYVQPEVLKHHVMEIRRALEDDPRSPLYIETLPRRGYRFIAPVGAAPVSASDAMPVNPHLVGRSAALAALSEHLRQACRGQMQFISVTGEPGIGKTALVDELQRQAKSSAPGLRIAFGQCVESFGSQEGYYPILEALGQLCRAPGGETIVDILASHAPTWLVQFPALLKREHRQTLQHELMGATGARMLREIGDALQTITASHPLLLVLEDLQWVDRSTVDVLSALARRRAPAKLMLVATIRSIEAMPFDHPLKALQQDLLMHGLCREIPLGPLTKTDVAEYLTATAPECDLPEGLADLIHRHSGGNPLFMTVALDHLERRGLVSCDSGAWRIAGPLSEIGVEVPETLRQMIEAQIERLSAEEQRALEVASVAGAVFSVEVAATATGADPDHFEDLYATLARRHRIIRPSDPTQFADAGDMSRYEFVHALYREVLYRRQTPRSRAKLHRRTGECLEKLALRECGEIRLDDIAAQLAHHFEQGMEWDKALRYVRLASDVAVKRFSPTEALSILGRGLDLVVNLRPEQRPAVELQLMEHGAMIAAANYHPTALERYEALEAKANDYSTSDVQVRALLGQAYPSSWISLSRSECIIDRAIELNRQQSDPVLRSIAHASCHFWRLWLGGWNDEGAAMFREARSAIEESADRHALAWYRLENTFVQFMSSHYRESRRQVELEIPVLLKGSIDAPDLNLGLAYWGCYQLVRPWSALFLGEWATAEREFEEQISVLERNHALYLANTLRLYRAWGQVMAHQFESARDVCAAITPGWDGTGTCDPSFPSVFLPCEERIRLVTLGAALAGLGQYDPALAYLQAARQQMLENPVVLHWYWRTAVEWVLAQLWIARGDPARAVSHAEDLLALTARSAEATWRALALEVAAQIAICRRDLPRARQHITEALSIVERFEIPVAAWRVQALATEFFEAAGDSTSAQHHRELARGATLRVGVSPSPGHAFRRQFSTLQPAS